MEFGDGPSGGKELVTSLRRRGLTFWGAGRKCDGGGDRLFSFRWLHPLSSRSGVDWGPQSTEAPVEVPDTDGPGRTRVSESPSPVVVA